MLWRTDAQDHEGAQYSPGRDEFRNTTINLRAGWISTSLQDILPTAEAQILKQVWIKRLFYSPAFV
jgi:hypothetical protein